MGYICFKIFLKQFQDKEKSRRARFGISLVWIITSIENGNEEYNSLYTITVILFKASVTEDKRHITQ